jgi:coenzyme PQQ synthesis protein D (PqqD)
VLTIDARLVKSEKIPWRLIEEEAILLDLEEGEVIRLNPVGAEIWNAIDGTRTVGEIVAHICRTFEVSHRTARRDANRFLKQLLRHELVEERPSVSMESA